MLAENLQAAQAMEVDVQLHFEEQQYSYQMKRTDTVETVRPFPLPNLCTFVHSTTLSFVLENPPLPPHSLSLSLYLFIALIITLVCFLCPRHDS